MEPPSDLIDHFKLNACHTNGITTETSYSSDPARGFRKVKVDRKWHRGQNLGHGAFGAVWLEENANATNEPKPKTARAVKEVSKPFMRHVHIDYNREILALAKLSRFPHEFVEFHGWFESDHLVFLVMEYVACGDLVGFIERSIGEGEARVIAGQLLEGLAVMHRFCFTHRDLKPSVSCLSHL
jgi:serine/threonine protein kinase